MIEINDDDVDRILADAHALAFPRYPGTEGDARAIGIVPGLESAPPPDFDVHSVEVARGRDTEPEAEIVSVGRHGGGVDITKSTPFNAGWSLPSGAR